MLFRSLYQLAALRPARDANDRATDRVAADSAGTTNSSGNMETAWELALAVNGPADESDLARLSRQRAEEVEASGRIRWLGAEDEISLAGAQIRGQNFWWYLVLLVLLCLLGELGMLAWTQWRHRGLAAAE